MPWAVIQSQSIKVLPSIKRARNGWRRLQFTITIDGNHRSIGCYGNEEEAAINYSLEKKQYRAEIMQRGISSSQHKEAHQDNIHNNVVHLNQSQHEAVSKHCNQKEEYITTVFVDEKISFPMELAKS